MRNLFVVLIMVLVSCSNESEIDRADLVGLWAFDGGFSISGSGQLITYEFGTDNSLEILAFYQTTDGEVLGFRSRSTGIYAVSGNDLYMDVTRVYQNDDTQVDFVETIEELTLTDQGWDQTVEVSFNETRSSMTFDYGPCEDTFSCIGTQTFARVE